MSKLFLREQQVLVARLDIRSSDLDIDFRLPFDDHSEPNMGEVIVYNLSQDKVNRITKGTEIIVNAGYKGDTGTVFLGVIEEIHNQWQRVDKLTRLVVGDASDRWFSGVISQSFQPGIKASQVMGMLLGSMGIEIGDLDLPNDITYKRGYVAEGMLKDELKRLANDAGAKLHISNGSIFVRPEDKPTETVVVLNANSGLVETPQRVEKAEGENRWSVWSLFNHRINSDVLVQVESKTLNGVLRVASGFHVANNADFLTHIEVVE